MSSRTKIIVTVLALVVLLGAGYIIFFNNNDTTDAVTTTGAPVSSAEVTFLDLASKINPITFDTSILSDPRFTALVDIHTAIIPETSGRKDPFASLAGTSSK